MYNFAKKKSDHIFLQNRGRKKYKKRKIQARGTQACVIGLDSWADTKQNVWNAGPTFASYLNFYIFFLSLICKNIWSVRNFAELYICRRGPQRQGPTAARHGGRGRGPLARAHTAVGHDVRSLTLCGTAVGAYRQAATWPPGSIAGHDGMCGPTTLGSGGRILFCEFQFLKH
jgi:hypothetical protein